MYPKSLQKMIDSFKLLPGVGEKTAERFALHLLSINKNYANDFASSIVEASDNIKECEICHFICEAEKCEICLDNSRDQNTICVVQSIRDVVILEKIGVFKGHYHVLGGVISPMDGVDVGDINISSLVKRLDDSQVSELIIATSPTVNGELTANYISKILANKSVKISRIAHGLPVGSDLEYADELTLFKALEGRREM